MTPPSPNPRDPDHAALDAALRALDSTPPVPDIDRMWAAIAPEVERTLAEHRHRHPRDPEPTETLSAVTTPLPPSPPLMVVGGGRSSHSGARGRRPTPGWWLWAGGGLAAAASVALALRLTSAPRGIDAPVATRVGTPSSVSDPVAGTRRPATRHIDLAAAATLLDRVTALRPGDPAGTDRARLDGRQLLARTRDALDRSAASTDGLDAREQRALLVDLEYALAQVVQGAADDAGEHELLSTTVQRRSLLSRLRAASRTSTHLSAS